MDQTRPLLVLFSFYSQCEDNYSTNLTKIEKSVDVELGIWTLDSRMVGTLQIASQDNGGHENEMLLKFIGFYLLQLVFGLGTYNR